MTSTAKQPSPERSLSTATEKPTANEQRILPKFFRPELNQPNEGIEVLTHFGFHAKVNGEVFLVN